MITSIELASLIYKIVSQTTVKALLGGGEIYLGNRPTNASKDDIVIGALSVPNIELQNSAALINIYCKDIYDGKTYSPNLKKLNEVTKFLLPFFDDVFIAEKGTYLDTEYVRDYQVQGVQEWVSVIRIKTRTINN